MDLLIEGLGSGFVRSVGFLIGMTLLPKTKPYLQKVKTALIDMTVRAAFKLKIRKKR